MEAMVDKLYGYLLVYGLNVLAAIVIFIVGRWLARAISNIIGKMMRKSNVDEMLTNFVKHITYFGMLVVVIVAALNKLGLQTTSLIAVLGAAGLAIGLAALGTGFAQMGIGAAAMGAIAEDEKMFGKGLILIALPETLVLFGFAIAFLLMQKIV